ncbi:MAG: hypothetical protein JWR03_94 [Cohnella sp.]|jgi:hypothetical protein|nr:hypothetical protein [Cohnella sp.]
MSKKKTASSPKPASDDKPATLKDLLGADTVAKLKEKAEALKSEELQRQEQKRKQEEEARKAEQKRLDNDFEYLLKNSRQDWKKFK